MPYAERKTEVVVRVPGAPPSDSNCKLVCGLHSKVRRRYAARMPRRPMASLAAGLAGALAVAVLELLLLLYLAQAGARYAEDIKPVQVKQDHGRFLGGVDLLLQWNFASKAARAGEYEKSLRHNVLNENIAAVHLFQSAHGDDYHHPESQQAAMCWLHEFADQSPNFCLRQEGPTNVEQLAASHAAIRGDATAYRDIVGEHVCRLPFSDEVDEACASAFTAKVQVHFVDFIGRLAAQDALAYASRHLVGRTCVLSNLDIIFDDTLMLVRNSSIDLGPSVAYFLSRYELPGSRSQLPSQCGPAFVGSHDALFFQPPLPRPLLERTAFRLGCWGSENRLMHEMEHAGLRVRNPCLDIHTWHVHETQYKAGWMPLVNDFGRSSAARPELLATRGPRRDTRRWMHEDPSGAFPTDTFVIRGQHSGQCLFSDDTGAVQQAHCSDDQSGMHWMLVDVDERHRRRLASMVDAGQKAKLVHIRSKRSLKDVFASESGAVSGRYATGKNDGSIWLVRWPSSPWEGAVLINAAHDSCLAMEFRRPVSAMAGKERPDACVLFIDKLYN